ncbi:hypothetical protein THMIRHAS_06290 [Thiosulfatimonas sediminis]|uniref:Outer membrane beta-barrel protein n=1 Tax=Thiosulfatimonas sediminis TaxID=2675054 RepID=A0A6F8PT41_9GAMM|nr:outer membrane beta-barrel protein [Thiosulfatimonas sediminis]BBP45256.1 hypothetical protein THMIRHAS_06290 [Thiosulfatimonas sediminis]
MAIKKPLLIPVILVSQSAFALDPQSFGEAGVYLTPTLSVGVTQDDNIRATSAATSSSVVSVTPNFALSAEKGANKFNANYSLNHRIYSVGSVDDLTDHNLNLSSNLVFDVRNNLSLSANYAKTENIADARVAGQVDKFSDLGFNGLYVYGAPSATGNIEVGVGHLRKRADDVVNADLERDVNSASILFSLQATAKTRFIAELNTSLFEYVSAQEKNGQNYAALAGVRWDATAKTSGQIKAGYQKKVFDDLAAEDSSIFNWDVSVIWAPKTYSTFTLTSSQKIDEGNYGAASADTQTNMITWAHDWGNRINSNVSFSYLNQDYSNGRKDESDSFSVGLDYAFRRWLDFTARYTYGSKNSTEQISNYDRNQYYIGATIAL